MRAFFDAEPERGGGRAGATGGNPDTASPASRRAPASGPYDVRRWLRWASWLIGWKKTLLVLLVVFGMPSLVLYAWQRGPYKPGVALLEVSVAARAVLGSPIDAGLPDGGSFERIDSAGPRGTATVAFKAAGPLGQGRVHVRARRVREAWRIEAAVLVPAGAARGIDLISDRPLEAGDPALDAAMGTASGKDW